MTNLIGARVERKEDKKFLTANVDIQLILI